MDGLVLPVFLIHFDKMPEGQNMLYFYNESWEKMLADLAEKPHFHGIIMKLEG